MADVIVTFVPDQVIATMLTLCAPNMLLELTRSPYNNTVMCSTTQAVIFLTGRRATAVQHSDLSPPLR
jgi:hypothetical protein